MEKAQKNPISLGFGDLQLLYFIGLIFDTYENGDLENFSAGLQMPEGVFHVVPPGGMLNLESTRGVRLEEGTHDLSGLVAGGVVCIGENRDFQIVGEPGGKLLRIALFDIFGDRDEDIIPLRPVLAVRSGAQQEREGSKDYEGQFLHPMPLL